MRAVLGGAVAAGLVLAVAGCAADAATGGSVATKRTLVVGVKADQPGLGMADASGRGFSGFEVDLGAAIAHRVGAADVRYAAVTSENREALLNAHKVDLVLASYSITAERSTRVMFGGPYYVAHQDIMVRAGERRIGGVRDLAGRRMCEASGSVSTSRVVRGLGIDAVLVPRPSYSACVRGLLDGELDAVSTGDLVLAGFSARGRGAVRILNRPFTEEPYGVGLRKGDVDGCEAVNKAITRLYQDGTAPRLLRKWFGTSGLANLAFTVPEFQGCS
ncbi:glutamate ABC transporter substrate-binding protein [Actinomadura logoneensis]|uniref:Glutamate ABC transporter substrate-binding protein n=1 Tax=Actinomadura logoneensis TaxID=2293572 RepID=A0A372JEX8_9ACTN|nr:glutamate ABC transporter substrate-binding protein [Actinomadura logoneensis]RFU38571.1 glutamate ABC transporter substrate-binding protein [Actinomadura logoneensis]